MIVAEQSRFLSTLRELGFAVIPDQISHAAIRRLSAAYDKAIATGKEPDLWRSSSGSNIRLAGLIGESAEFDELYALQPILEACEDTIAGPFVLSSMCARTVLPGATKQGLHVDVKPDDDACPLIGFIIMVDAFRNDNGATRFIPGSHRRESSPGAYETNQRPDDQDEVPACGPAGSLIVYNGSTWHNFGANVSGVPRRSIQGAYIPRGGKPGVEWATRLRTDVVDRLSLRARSLLGID
jgi:ectoine hydroxylase-related dioxygenase (phytanoyl-CoA dioxygenase family)